jgi:hypothetical protein
MGKDDLFGLELSHYIETVSREKQRHKAQELYYSEYESKNRCNPRQSNTHGRGLAYHLPRDIARAFRAVNSVRTTRIFVSNSPTTHQSGKILHWHLHDQVRPMGVNSTVTRVEKPSRGNWIQCILTSTSCGQKGILHIISVRCCSSSLDLKLSHVILSFYGTSVAHSLERRPESRSKC